MALKLIVKKQEDFGDTTVKELILEEALISAGCDFNSTIFLDDEQIANEQFVVIIEDEKPVLVNRSEGTFFNDEPLPREVRCELNNGDEIQIGSYTISFLNVNYKAKKSIFIPATSTATVKVIENVDINNEFISDIDTHTNGNGNGNGNGIKPQKSFADILSSLRKDEDRFYFQIVNGDTTDKLTIEKEEIEVGWDLTGRILSGDPNIVVMPRANITKDWGGVMVTPLTKESVWVNNESVDNPKRLKNGDKLTFLSAFSSGPQKNVFLEFCEPAALVEINSILPQDLPSVAPNRTDLEEITTENNIVQETVTNKQVTGKVKPKKSVKKKYFGYFTFGEVFIMFLGTILTAALVFIILEYW